MESRRDTERRRLQREYDNRPSLHHIINKSSKELFDNLNDKDNLKEWKRWPHRKRHEMHHNEHPLETLQKTERFKQVMSEKATELYEALISMSKEEFYDKKFLPKKGL